MRGRWKHAVLAAAVWGFGSAAFAAVGTGGSSFTGVGDLPGGVFQSSVAAVSPDGGTVVGQSFSGPSSATTYTWTAAGGMVPVNAPIRPRAISAGAGGGGGATIVGDNTNNNRAARWTSAGGVQTLEPQPDGIYRSQGIAANADASVIVGMRDETDGDDGVETSPGSQAYRWTTATGIALLGDLPGGRIESFAHGVSNDGTIVVGYGTDANGNKAFRWTAGSGMQSLGLLAGIGESRANGISADGTVIVGWSAVAGGVEAFRWTSIGGMTSLGDLAGGATYSEARAASGNGNVIVGYGTAVDNLGFNTDRAFIWRPGLGMRDLKTVLQTEYGLNLTGWDLFDARAISFDGSTIAGSGRNPSGNFEGWVAVIPEPASVGLLGLGALALQRGNRRRRAATS